MLESVCYVIDQLQKTDKITSSRGFVIQEQVAVSQIYRLLQVFTAHSHLHCAEFQVHPALAAEQVESLIEKHLQEQLASSHLKLMFPEFVAAQVASLIEKHLQEQLASSHLKFMLSEFVAAQVASLIDTHLQEQLASSHL
jgi:hypothetical protein